jgi:hypothetical protein
VIWFQGNALFADMSDGREYRTVQIVVNKIA